MTLRQTLVAAWAGLVLCGSAPTHADGLDAILSPKGLDGFVTVDRIPVPDHPTLQSGQVVWGGLCQNCHGGDRLTGAPKITATDVWAPRIEQGLPTLIDHAINGFYGPTYKEMPPRGGNPDLTDAQVIAAVAFMVWASGGADEALAYLNTSGQ